MENSLILQVKAVKELLHPFNQDVRQEAPHLSLFLHCKGDYKLNILDLYSDSFWQMWEIIYKNWINSP